MSLKMLRAWGKARGEPGEFHPAAYHCLDVAACAVEALNRLPILCDRLRAILETDNDNLILTLIALHDVGKFSRQFQGQQSKLISPAYGDVSSASGYPSHATAGMLLWIDRLHEMTPGGLDLMPLARAAFGHHGRPVPEDGPRVRAQFGAHGLACADQFAREIVAIFEPQPVAGDLSRASWLLNGLCALADWLGSSRDPFEYTRPDLSLADYYEQIARPRARIAADRAGITPATVRAGLAYPDLTGVKCFHPTPMQEWARDVELPDGPMLAIIEDSTGAGKTEAAHMLAHRMMASGRANGVYIALPTMATADGMFDRMVPSYQAMFAGRASIALAHGSRDLSNAFERVRLDPESDGDCAPWIADDKRLTFLAQVGVGTVDQALLAVLPSAHQSVRLIGLAQRVLVLDEVHAYDAYVSSEIEALLTFHAAFGGSAILLSATLPVEVKRRFASIYGAELDCRTEYPLASTVAGGNVEQAPVAPRTETVRSVPLQFVGDDGLTHAIAAARSGQAVLYIRNTIRDAVEAFEAVPDDITADLFHARFAMCNRLAIQGDALSRFGKDSTPDERAGRLLIATQVVEQSLDLDFDLIVSDLALVDSIIQRAGRLWRHTRERPNTAERRMIVVGPEPADDADASWLRDAMPGTSRVYEDHARMWLTAEILRRGSTINAPDGLRTLIEHVYGPHAENRIPAGLAETLTRIGERAANHRMHAEAMCLRLRDGYALAGTAWDSDERMQTRLGAASVTVRLARARGSRIEPWAYGYTNESNWQKVWALSEARAPAWWFAGKRADVVPPGFDAAAVDAKSSWSKWQRDDVLLLVVEDDGEIGTDFQYSARLGLRRVDA